MLTIVCGTSYQSLWDSLMYAHPSMQCFVSLKPKQQSYIKAILCYVILLPLTVHIYICNVMKSIVLRHVWVYCLSKHCQMVLRNKTLLI